MPAQSRRHCRPLCASEPHARPAHSRALGSGHGAGDNSWCPGRLCLFHPRLPPQPGPPSPPAWLSPTPPVALAAGFQCFLTTLSRAQHHLDLFPGLCLCSILSPTRLCADENQAQKERMSWAPVTSPGAALTARASLTSMSPSCASPARLRALAPSL